MKKLTILLIMCLYSLTFSQNDYIILPASTIVVVQTSEKLSGEYLKRGQEITCRVAVDVIIEDEVLIKAGTPVFCQVDDASSAGMVGQAGDLVLSIRNTTTVDGKTVLLSGSFGTKGQSKVGETVACAVILCPLALLFSGEEAEIPAGAQVRAFTVGDVKVKIKR